MMNKYLVLGALPAVLASPPHLGHQTTKTVYATSVHTVTSCKPEVTNCPAKKGPVVVTEVVAVSTTVCAVTETETSTKAPVGCSTATSYSDCVHTITKTAPAFTVVTSAPFTTISKDITTVSTSTCVHTIPGKDGKDLTVTTEYPVTTVKPDSWTRYTTKTATITGATSLLVVTTAIPTTYTVCPVKPTWPVDEEPAHPTGSWPPPPGPEDEPDVKPTGTWPTPEVTGAAPVKPTGTGSWAHTTTSGNKATVTAGAAAFGASGALKMLGAAAAAALLL
jgi:hypothetical protein